MSSRTTPDVVTRRAAAGHLSYEHRRMTALVAECLKFTEAGDALLADATLESFLVHCRCLLEFLHRRGAPRHSNDVWPQDFVPTWSERWDPTRVDRWFADIDRHLSHLTYSRVTAGKIDWNVTELESFITTAYDRFVADAVAQNAPGFDLGRQAVTAKAVTHRPLASPFVASTASPAAGEPITLRSGADDVVMTSGDEPHTPG